MDKINNILTYYQPTNLVSTFLTNVFLSY